MLHGWLITTWAPEAPEATQQVAVKNMLPAGMDVWGFPEQWGYPTMDVWFHGKSHENGWWTGVPLFQETTIWLNNSQQKQRSTQRLFWCTPVWHPICRTSVFSSVVSSFVNVQSPRVTVSAWVRIVICQKKGPNAPWIYETSTDTGNELHTHIYNNWDM